MIQSNRQQSLEELTRSLPETIERVGTSKAAEYITVAGQPKAVLLSVDEYQRLIDLDPAAHEAQMMRASYEAYLRGEFLEVRAFGEKLRAASHHPESSVTALETIV